MLRRSATETNKKTVVFAATAFVAFALLVLIFPYSGDDWAWGSEIGLQRLATGFEDYNGRYAGNLLVMALTRSKLLNALFTAFSLVCVCFLPKAYSRSERFSPLLLAAALFLLLPKAIWVQSVSWTAGFSNYIPPVLLTTSYMVLTSNVFGAEKPVYGALAPVAALLIGFVSSLFMENVTLYALVLSAGVMLYALFRHKKLFAVHISNLVGCAAGTLLMFSNSAYGIIANADDGYRSTALSEGLYKTLESHVETVIYIFFTKNFLMLIIISLLCVALTASFIKTAENEKEKSIAKKAATVNVICLGVVLLRSVFGVWVSAIPVGGIKFALNCFVLLAAAIYFLALCVTAAVCVKDKTKKGAVIASVFSLPVLMAPLLVVNPIGPRCFFPPYFICILICVCLYDCLLDGCSDKKDIERYAVKPLVATSCAMLAVLFAVYVPVHYYNVRRNSYAIRQAELGYEKITVCRLPFKSYVWTGDPEKEPWTERYKLFYGFDSDVQLEILSCEEFDEWAENFDREVLEK